MHPDSTLNSRPSFFDDIISLMLRIIGLNFSLNYGCFTV